MLSFLSPVKKKGVELEGHLLKQGLTKWQKKWQNWRFFAPKDSHGNHGVAHPPCWRWWYQGSLDASKGDINTFDIMIWFASWECEIEYLQKVLNNLRVWQYDYGGDLRIYMSMDNMDMWIQTCPPVHIRRILACSIFSKSMINPSNPNNYPELPLLSEKNPRETSAVIGSMEGKSISTSEWKP